MKTFLVKIQQDNNKTAAAFADVLTQLHETVRGDRFALELLASGQNIAFCFTASAATCEIIAGQIYAIAPDCDIIEIQDFTQNLPTNMNFVSAELNLARKDLYPLKTYDDFDGDSLSGLLSVLSKVEPGEHIVFQIVVHPRKDSGWHHLVLIFRKKFDRIRHLLRVKYWFKRGFTKFMREQILQKTSGRLFETNIRIAVIADGAHHNPILRLQAMLGAVANYNTLDLNQLKPSKIYRIANLAKFRRRELNKGFLLSTKELAAIYHLPNEDEVPNIVHVLSKREAAPKELPTDQEDPEISFFGMTNFRGQRIPFGIKRSDRRRHLYMVGKSGSGKSKMLQLLIQTDLLQGRGVGVLDPHGDLVDEILQLVPKDRIKDVVLFDPSDLEFPASFNPLEQVPEELKMRVTIGFIEIFKKLFGSNWSPRIEHVLRYTTLALLDSPNTTVLSILKMLTDKNYRQLIVRNIQDNVVKNFWVNEFAAWSEKFDNEAITPLLNKVGQFVATNMIRNIVGQPVNRFDFRKIMDERKILLMKISKGMLGEENAALLGAIAITKIYQAAMSRADIPEQKRIDFYFYVDEFHNFATDSFDEILSESRKYRLNLTLANQFLGQLDDKIRKTVFGNVGSLASFRVGGEDAKIMAAEYAPRFNERDIINLGVRDFCIKMSIDGEIHDAFSGRTLQMQIPEKNYAKEAVKYSRENYSMPLAEVKETLNRWEEGDWGQGASLSRLKAANDPFEEVEFEEPLI